MGLQSGSYARSKYQYGGRVEKLRTRWLGTRLRHGNPNNESSHSNLEA